MKLCVFFERDGVLNHARVERHQQVSPLTLAEFQPRREIRPWLDQLKRAGFLLIATTNQPGLSRGYQSRRELDRMHALLFQEFPLDDVLVCPHDEFDRCPCRKPRTGLFVEAGFKWNIALDRSYVVSDKWYDAEAARAVGCTSLLLESPWIRDNHHDLILPSFPAAVQKILQLQSASRVLIS